MKTPCWLRGHGPFYQRHLPVNRSVSYPTANRDAKGRPLGWPTCSRCGWMVITMEYR